MPEKDYGLCVVEGGDQVGKGDGTERIAQELVEHLPVTKIAFPAYSLPVGATIRHMLRNGLEEVFEEGEITAEEEFETRMALYALNRLEMTNSLLEERYVNRFLLFDRSPYSNALTIAYGLGGSGDITEEELYDYVQKGIDYDKYIIEKLNMRNCVIEFYDESQKEWGGTRSEGDDQYESADVQAVAGKVYNIFSEEVGIGWTKIPTITSEGWRDRQDILKDSMEFIYSKYPHIKDMVNEEDKEIEILEVQDASRSLYRNSVVSDEYLAGLEDALRFNNKKDMYKYSLLIADEIASSCNSVGWVNSEIKEAFKEIIQKTPHAVKVISHFMGEEYARVLKESYE